MTTAQRLPLSSELGGRSAVLPLDASIEYIRRHLWRVLPIYVVAIVPTSAVMLIIVDAVSSQHRSALRGACGLLTLASVWRWVFVAAVQRRVQEDLRGEPSHRLRANLHAILLLRLWACAAMLWGGLLIVPAFYGLFLSGFAAPAILESKASAWSHAKEVLALIHKSAARLGRASFALAVTIIVALISTMALHGLLVHQFLPGLLGLDAADLALTVQSVTWMICVAYFLFLVFDFYWAVGSVFLFYDLQARRLGTDLRMRLRGLEAAE